MAIALYEAFNPNFQTQIDPSYGRVAFRRWKWGVNEKGMTYFEVTDLKSHLCSPEELGLKGDDPKFWPINESSANMLE